MGQTITGLRPDTGHGTRDGQLFAANTQLETVTCATCGMLYAIPVGLVRSAKRWRGDRRDGKGWSLCCPIGHVWHYVGENDEQRLIRQRDEARDSRARLRAELDQMTSAERNQRAAKSRALTANRKLKHRVAAGVCPCCTRSFANLERHMASQHPDYPERKETP